MHPNFFKETVDSLRKEEGLTKIRKVQELSALAEQGEWSGVSLRYSYQHTMNASRAQLFSHSPGFGLGRKESQY